MIVLQSGNGNSQPVRKPESKMMMSLPCNGFRLGGLVMKRGLLWSAVPDLCRGGYFGNA